MYGSQDIVKEIILNNGLRVWLSSDRSLPKVFGSVVVLAGSKHSPNTGIAHYFEHIMFKGTKRIGTIDYDKEAPILKKIEDCYLLLSQSVDDIQRAEIQSQINDLSIQAAEYAIPNDFNNLISKYGGTDLNAGTSYDYTIFHNTFSPEFLEHWCELNSERLIDPVFRLFQSELETVYEEKNMYADSYSTEPTQRIFHRIASPHPYCFPIIGNTQALKNPDLVAMKHFFEHYYKADNMGLILVGDIDINDIVPLLNRTFGRVRTGKVPQDTFSTPNRFKGHELLNIKIPIPFVGANGLIWHTVPNNHPDQLPLTLMQLLLTNDGKTGLLDQLIIDDQVMETGAMNFALNDMGIFALYTLSKPFRSNYFAHRRVVKELQRLKEGDFSEEKLQEVKLLYKKSCILQIEDPEKRAQLLGQLFAQKSTWQDFLYDLNKIETVTKQEIIQVANHYIGSDYLEVRKKTGKYPKEKMKAPSFRPLNTPNRHAESDFAKYLSTLHLPKYEVNTLDFSKDVERCLLNSNGSARLLKVTNHNNNLFSLELLYYRQSYQHPLLEHIDYYLNLAGGNGWTAKQFNAKLQSIGSTVSYECKESFFIISISGFDDYFEETISLLGSFLFNVNMEKKHIHKMYSTQKVAQKALLKDTSMLSKRLFDLARYGRDKAPFVRELTPKEIKIISPETIEKEVNQLLKCEVDIHYTGTLNITEIAPIVAKAFQTNKIIHSGEGFRYIEAKSVEKPLLFITDDRQATQSIIRVCIPMGKLSAGEKAALRVYGVYFGKGMGSLLFQEVRENRSLAYGVGGYPNFAPANQSDLVQDYIIYLSTQSDKTAEALHLVEELKGIIPNDPSRYAYARNEILSSVRGFYPSLRMKSRTITSLERQGYTRDITLHIQEELEHLSIEDVVNFHRKHIKDKVWIATLVGNCTLLDIKALEERYKITRVVKNELVD